MGVAGEGILAGMSRFMVCLVLLDLGTLLSATSGCRNTPPAAAPAAQGSTAAPVQVPTRGDDSAAAHALLLKGRTAAQTDLPAAIAAFAAAQKLAPEDPEILSELGQAQFRAGDLKRAEDTTRAALRAAQTPAETAAPAYNLGRIEEAAGHIDEAVTAYELAIAARPSPEIQQRLDALKAVRGQRKP